MILDVKLDAQHGVSEGWVGDGIESKLNEKIIQKQKSCAQYEGSVWAKEVVPFSHYKYMQLSCS